MERAVAISWLFDKDKKRSINDYDNETLWILFRYLSILSHNINRFYQFFILLHIYM